MVTSKSDVLFVDLVKKEEIDFNAKEMVSQIENVKATQNHFYVLANKKDSRLGYFLFQIDINRPHDKAVFFVNWSNKLDIGNCDIQIMKETMRDGSTEENIVVSYKSIGINTYNVFVIDIKSKLIKYWHEGY